jgi:ribosome-binding ATPase YchF (GTP1/OBG family)
VGDWENAVTTWTDDSTNFVGNSALLFVNPTVIAGAIGDATIARVPGLLKALYAADDSEFVADTARVEAAVGTGEAADTAFDAEKALDKMVPGVDPQHGRDGKGVRHLAANVRRAGGLL